MYSHIYIEKKAANSETARIARDKYRNSQIIYTDHYKDVFNRPHQNFSAQKEKPSLIIAHRQDEPVYKGSPLCQSFGNINFYYTSNILGCPFNCEYCYLSGMYPSGNTVIFSDTEYVFSEVERLLSEPLYLCISYDTDLLAFENTFGFVKMWMDFAERHSALKIEIRTKCGSFPMEHSQNKNIIFAWTLSPEIVVENFEHKTGSLSARINAIKKAVSSGFKVRLCFDPILMINNFEKEYEGLIDRVFSEISAEGIVDASVGSFRISSQYMKNMRRRMPNKITFYPFVCENGSYSYGAEKNKYMTDFVKNALLKHIPEDKIFVWNG